MRDEDRGVTSKRTTEEALEALATATTEEVRILQSILESRGRAFTIALFRGADSANKPFAVSEHHLACILEGLPVPEIELKRVRAVLKERVGT